MELREIEMELREIEIELRIWTLGAIVNLIG